MTEHKYTNKLASEKSPYLLQHAHNPVYWYPWSDEAFEKAKSQNKPIFLSIGYSTCHWCHVMERESFEDSEVAEVLNNNFISIKVDREERPDIDHIYMDVCQALTGHGGWPLTIIMTPDKKPFYAGTYFPKHDRMGIPGILTLMDRVTEAWNKDSYSLVESGEKIIAAVNQPQNSPLDIDAEALINDAYLELREDFDNVYGGFGNAPKFPSPHNLYFLMRYWYIKKDSQALEMVEKTLDAMYSGGIYDHIGFGFSRYSTDRRWLVPHFEKMLYDNALIAIAYLECFQATKKDIYADIARQIFTYVARDMTSIDGGFYSAEDADSEGMEGKFYLWTPDEVKHILGDKEGEWFCRYYGINNKGNFEGFSIANLIKSALPSTESEFVEKCRKKLFEYREKRIHPYKDDKILSSWNGLMISAMAMGGRFLGEDKYTKASEKALQFIYSKLVRDDGRLMARYRDGESAYPGYVDDHAFLIWGLIELYESTYKPEYLQKALNLNDILLKLFWDEESGGLFMYGSDSEQLITRPKEIYDGATPSGNSVAAMNFLRLARLTGNHKLEELANRQLKAFGSAVQRFPRGYTFFITALLFAQTPTKEIVLVGNADYRNSKDMVNVLREDFRPFTSSVYISEDNSCLKQVMPFIENYKAVNGKATAYVCENYSCQAPITDTATFRDMLS